MRCSSRPLCLPALAVALAAAVLSCCGSEDPPPSDAGMDAGEPEPRDAGPDVSTDTGVDAAPVRDAGHAEWTQVTGLPDGCPVWIAENPEAVVPRLTFEECPQYDTGCRQVRIDWKEEVGEHYFQIFSGYHNGDHGYFSYWRGSDEAEHTWVIGRDDGAILSVLRVPTLDGTGCLAVPAVLGGARFAFALIRFEGGDLITNTWFLVGTLASPADSLRVMATLSPSDIGPNTFPQRLVVTETHLAIEVVPRHDVFLLDDAGAIVTSTAALSSTVDLEGAVRDTFFADHHTTPREILSGKAGEDPSVLLPADGSSVANFSTDGSEMAWLKLVGWDGARADRVELWGSRYAEVPGDVEPVMLGEVAFTEVYVGGGRITAAAVGPGGGLEAPVFDADGTRVGVVTPPAGTEYQGLWAAFLGPEEIAVAPRPVRTAGDDAFSVQFIRYDVLTD